MNLISQLLPIIIKEILFIVFEIINGQKIKEDLDYLETFF